MDLPLATDATQSEYIVPFAPSLTSLFPLFSVSENDTNIPITAHVKNLGIFCSFIPHM